MAEKNENSKAIVTVEELFKKNKIDLSDLELVKLCQRAENNFVGLKCGILDTKQMHDWRVYNGIPM